jgi:hypothetical protein
MPRGQISCRRALAHLFASQIQPDIQSKQKSQPSHPRQKDINNRRLSDFNLKYIKATTLVFVDNWDKEN